MIREKKFPIDSFRVIKYHANLHYFNGVVQRLRLWRSTKQTLKLPRPLSYRDRVLLETPIQVFSMPICNCWKRVAWNFSVLYYRARSVGPRKEEIDWNDFCENMKKLRKNLYHLCIMISSVQCLRESKRQIVDSEMAEHLSVAIMKSWQTRRNFRDGYSFFFFNRATYFWEFCIEKGRIAILTLSRSAGNRHLASCDIFRKTRDYFRRFNRTCGLLMALRGLALRLDKRYRYAYEKYVSSTNESF